MFRNLSNDLRPWLFYGLALAMSLGVSLLPGASTELAMLTPAVSVCLLLLVVTREGWQRDGWAKLGLHRPAIRYWPLALGLPIAVLGTAHAVLWLSPVASLSATEPTRGFGLEMLPLALLGNIAFASVTVSLTEEIGWRGYLLPRLTRIGTRRALVLSGFLHGIWHLPVMLLTGLYHPNGSRWLVVPLFLLAVTAAGVFMGWLRLRSGSVWPAVLAHSSHNAAMNLIAAYTIGSAATVDLFASEWGLITVTSYVGVAAVLLTRGRVSTETPPVAGAAVAPRAAIATSTAR